MGACALIYRHSTECSKESTTLSTYSKVITSTVSRHYREPFRESVEMRAGALCRVSVQFVGVMSAFVITKQVPLPPGACQCVIFTHTHTHTHMLMSVCKLCYNKAGFRVSLRNERSTAQNWVARSRPGSSSSLLHFSSLSV